MNMATWLPVIVAVLSFFLTKKSGGSTAQAAGVAALTGVATYAVQNNTEWGREHLSSLDKADMTSNPTLVERPKLDAQGNKIPKVDGNGDFILDANNDLVFETEKVVVNPKYDPASKTITAPPTGTVSQPSSGGLSDFWKSMGAAGQTAVAAGAGVVAAKTIPTWAWLAAGGLGLYLILKD